MTDYKVRKNPALPAIPSESDWQDFDRIIKWRRGHLTVLQQLHSDTYDDVHTLENATANNANDIANNANDISNNANAIANVAIYQDVILYPWEMSNYGASNWAAVVSANQFFNGYYHNVTANNFDALYRTQYLRAGTYLWGVFGITTANSGIASLQIDATTYAAIDMYTSSTGYNYFASNSSVVVGSSGTHALYVKVNSKNASSSGYKLYITYSHLRRVS